MLANSSLECVCQIYRVRLSFAAVYTRLAHLVAIERCARSRLYGWRAVHCSATFPSYVPAISPPRAPGQAGSSAEAVWRERDEIPGRPFALWQFRRPLYTLFAAVPHIRSTLPGSAIAHAVERI